MSIPISGHVPQRPNINNVNNNSNTATPKTAKEMEGAIQRATQGALDASRVIDSELSFMGDKAKLAQKKTGVDGQQSGAQLPSAGHIPEEAVAAFAANAATAEEVRRKQKKEKSKWKDQMEEMEGLAEMISAEETNDPQEKGIIQEFLDNMKKLRELRRKIKQTKEQKERHQQLLEQYRKQQSQEQQSYPDQ